MLYLTIVDHKVLDHKMASLRGTPKESRNKQKSWQTESFQNGSSCPSRQSETMYHVGIGVEVVNIDK